MIFVLFFPFHHPSSSSSSSLGIAFLSIHLLHRRPSSSLQPPPARCSSLLTFILSTPIIFHTSTIAPSRNTTRTPCPGPSQPSEKRHDIEESGDNSPEHLPDDISNSGDVYFQRNEVKQATDTELAADAAIERDWIKTQQLHYRYDDDRRKNEEFGAAPEDVKPASTITGDYFARLSFNPTLTMTINLRIEAYQSSIALHLRIELIFASSAAIRI